MTIIPMDEIKRIYKPGPGRHWFDADSMRFFRSHLAQIGYQAADGAIYFVTSEQFVNGAYRAKRLFSVRCLRAGSISTVGGFHAFGTSATATKYARGYASGNISLPVDAKAA